MAQRILIVGRGTAGTSLARSIRESGGEVVGFLDDAVVDDEVLGTLADASRVIAQHEVGMVYFAIPSVDAGVLRSFLDSVDSDHVEIAIVPRTYRTLAKEQVDLSDLTDVDVLDLVGRKPVKHDLLESAAFLRGQRVLVTGAAGSIGSTLVRQIATMDPDAIVCVDWWENGMFFLEQEFADDPRISYHVADVKSSARLKAVFAEMRPTVVFHAAAYKHVPMMQRDPVEAINNNIGGSVAVMRTAVEAGVRHVVYVSTDKAVNPVNVMGATKRIGEIAMTDLARHSSATSLTAVRFGNVIESNGSVMQTFRSQLARRAPLTVTDPEVTRFFMTLDEAAQLVIQSAFIGASGDIFVLDMGEPVRIMDLAASLSRLVDPPADIEIIGLRPGEKMYEELSYEPDRIAPTRNPKIFAVTDDVVTDPTAFMLGVADLLERAQRFEISRAEIVDALRVLGFAIR
ncbi:polysaccharide biosynthesis protein [Pseudolysinimonas kribbensis]